MTFSIWRPTSPCRAGYCATPSAAIAVTGAIEHSARGSTHPLALPRLARFRQGDGNGLITARYLLSRTASQLADLLLVHDLLDFSLLLCRFHRLAPQKISPLKQLACRRCH